MKKNVVIVLLSLLVVGCGKSEPSVQQQSGEDKPVKHPDKQADKQPKQGTEQSKKVHMPKPNQYQAIKVLLEVEAETFSYNTQDENVVEVCLQAAKITTDELACLTRLRELESLDLSGSNITDSGLVHLKGLVKLKSLDLSDTEITDAGLVHLKGLVKLESFNLGVAGISDVGLKHLQGLTSLTGLNLQDTEVTDEGVAELQKSLPNCSTVR